MKRLKAAPRIAFTGVKPNPHALTGLDAELSFAIGIMVLVHRRAAEDVERMCSFTWLGDDSQVKTPAFGKVIGLIVCEYIREDNSN